jgi:hypothetical protein
MKNIALRIVFATSLLAGPTGAAHAAGCLKGAMIGGVAGHFAHHPILGAAAGCAIGHHRAAVAQREQLHQQQNRQTHPAHGSQGGF